jgi:hypothetical protein
MNRLQHQKNRVLTAVIALAVIGVAAMQLARAAEAKAKYTIKEVMKATNKGDTSIGKRVAQGMGTAEDFAKLVEYYSALPHCTPEKGDKASWDAKSAALLKAAQALKAGEPNALANYKKAANCKACHSAHKPD